MANSTGSADLTTGNSTLDEWTRALGESSGSPGGGAAAGVMLAIAASLTSMVAGYTRLSEDQQEDLHALRTRAGQLRRTALQAADDDAAASRAFGAAFTLPRGPQRTDAIHQASLEAAESSAVLGEHAVRAIDDAVWLAEKGNPSLIADVMVAFGALRTALTAARTNVSFDLASLRSSGFPLEEIRKQQPQLWTTVETFDAAIDRIDAIMAAVDDRAAPTDSA